MTTAIQQMTAQEWEAAMANAQHRVNMVELGLIDDDTAWDDYEALSEAGNPDDIKLGLEYGICHACPMGGTLVGERDGSVRCNCCGHIAFG